MRLCRLLMFMSRLCSNHCIPLLVAPIEQNSKHTVYSRDIFFGGSLDGGVLMVQGYSLDSFTRNGVKLPVSFLSHFSVKPAEFPKTMEHSIRHYHLQYQAKEVYIPGETHSFLLQLPAKHPLSGKDG